MLQAEQIALIDGKPVYKDCNGKLCVETDNFQHLRSLTSEEKGKLLKTLKAANPVDRQGGGRK